MTVSILIKMWCRRQQRRKKGHYFITSKKPNPYELHSNKWGTSNQQHQYRQIILSSRVLPTPGSNIREPRQWTCGFIGYNTASNKFASIFSGNQVSPTWVTVLRRIIHCIIINKCVLCNYIVHPYRACLWESVLLWPWKRREKYTKYWR